MKSLLFATLALSGLLVLPAAAAEMQSMPTMKESAAKPAALQTHKGRGTVNRIDAAGGKINLTHGAIESLGLPGMTMDFPVKDKAVLAGIAAGQRVEFELVQEGNQYFVSRITPLK